MSALTHVFEYLDAKPRRFITALVFLATLQFSLIGLSLLHLLMR